MLVTIFDSEANGFLEVADKVWCVAMLNSKFPDKPSLYWHKDGLRESWAKDALNYLTLPDVLVGHNIIKFDLPLFKKLLGWEPNPNQIILDTLVFSRMLNPKRPLPEGYKGKATHSLEAWGYRLGLAKLEHDDWTQWSEDMGERCIGDVKLNLLVLKELEIEAGNISDYYERLRRC